MFSGTRPPPGIIKPHRSPFAANPLARREYVQRNAHAAGFPRSLQRVYQARAETGNI